MIVLGIDPGVATIGFGVVRAERQKNTLVQYGVITTPPGIPLSSRLLQISDDMEELIRTFHPDENITLAMGVTMATRLLGYTDADFSGAWPSGQMTLYRNLNLDEGISIGQNSTMTRQDSMSSPATKQTMKYRAPSPPTRRAM